MCVLVRELSLFVFVILKERERECVRELSLFVCVIKT